MFSRMSFVLALARPAHGGSKCIPSTRLSRAFFSTQPKSSEDTPSSVAALSFNGKSYFVPCNLHGENATLPGVSFQVDTGCTYTQIDMHTAGKLGLLGHEKILGASALGNNNKKYDYLSAVKLSLLGNTADLVIKVAPNQPCLLGLDAMHAFGVDILISEGKYSVTLKQPPHFFNQFTIANILLQFGVTRDQLVPLNTLPPVEESAAKRKKEMQAGTTCNILDLGTTLNIKLWTSR
jgi:hypothetical protein